MAYINGEDTAVFLTVEETELVKPLAMGTAVENDNYLLFNEDGIYNAKSIEVKTDNDIKYMHIVPSTTVTSVSSNYLSFNRQHSNLNPFYVDINATVIYAKILMRTNYQGKPRISLYQITDSDGNKLSNINVFAEEATAANGEWEALIIPITITDTNAALAKQFVILPSGFTALSKYTNNTYFDVAAWALFDSLSSAEQFDLVAAAKEPIAVRQQGFKTIGTDSECDYVVTDTSNATAVFQQAIDEAEENNTLVILAESYSGRGENGTGEIVINKSLCFVGLGNPNISLNVKIENGVKVRFDNIAFLKGVTIVEAAEGETSGDVVAYRCTFGTLELLPEKHFDIEINGYYEECNFVDKRISTTETKFVNCKFDLVDIYGEFGTFGSCEFNNCTVCKISTIAFFYSKIDKMTATESFDGMATLNDCTIYGELPFANGENVTYNNCYQREYGTLINA